MKTFRQPPLQLVSKLILLPLPLHDDNHTEYKLESLSFGNERFAYARQSDH